MKGDKFFTKQRQRKEDHGDELSFQERLDRKKNGFVRKSDESSRSFGKELNSRRDERSDNNYHWKTDHSSSNNNELEDQEEKEDDYDQENESSRPKKKSKNL
jgi:hypothetical protein